MVGKTLGHYQILEPLGKGGMGEVYRARDTKLDRDVAIKVLPEDFATDQDRLARFEREAKLLASLNHANIAAIYGLEDEGDQRFIVMEVVEGETLGERISRSGRIEVEEALEIARQIAEALEAAHDNGVIHRDLKPANVIVTPDGMVKVLDFGLAKAYEADGSPSEISPDLSHSPTVMDATRTGVILGTASYMSPEQARGKPVDKRTDIWAFGCVLYEMLAGRKLFEGNNVADVLAAVMTQDVSVDALPSSFSPSLRVLLGRCLERDPRRRLRDIGEARIALECERDSPGTTTIPGTAVPSQAAARHQGARRIQFSLLAVALVALGASLGIWWWRSPSKPLQLLQSSLAPPSAALLEPEIGFALSPDGLHLAFVARDARGAATLWVRPLASLEARPLAGTEGARQPFWSPDGRDIGFFADERLKRVPAAGGTVQTIVGPAPESKGAAWSAAGRIVYTPNYRGGLFEVPAHGGEVVALTELDAEDGELSHRWPQFLPDGRTLLFLVQTAEAGASDDRSGIEVLNANGTRNELLKVNSSAVYTPSGQLLFWREGSIYAQELDSEPLRLRGEPQHVVDGVGFSSSEWATFSVSGEGTLVYHRASPLPWRLEWRDRSGKLLSEAAPEGEYFDLALSPDGSRVAYVADNIVLWIRDLARGTSTRLSFEEVDHYAPTWSTRGDWIVYAALKQIGVGSELLRRPSLSFGEKEILYTSGSTIRDISWSRDGRWIAFDENYSDILLLDLESGETRIRVGSPGNDASPVFSPDGQWLAYDSNESGQREVYVVATADGPERWQISSDGGFQPEWSPDGDELFFIGLDLQLKVATVDLEGDPVFGLPEPLFAVPYGGAGRSYKIAPDGRMLLRAQQRGNGENFTLVRNWPLLLAGSER